MYDYPQRRAAAARWIYDRKDRVTWWRWSVLTEHNKDPESLKIHPEAAYIIFADLVKQGLFLPVVADDGGDALTMNPGKEDEWKQVKNPRWRSLREGGSKLFDYIVGGFIGAIIGVAITVAAQRLFGIR